MKANSTFKPATLPPTLLELHEALREQPTPQAAWDIVKEYFFFFGADGMQGDLWQMLSATLTHREMPVLGKSVNRHNLIFFYEFTLIFTEAAHLLLQQQKEDIDNNPQNLQKTLSTSG